MTRNKKQNKKSSSRAGQIITVPQSIRPIQYNANFGCNNVRRRFIVNASGAVSTVVNAATLVQAYGLTCTTTNGVAVPVFISARLKSVQVWGVPAATPGTPSVATVVWNYQNSAGASTYSNNREATDISTSTAYTPYVMTRPPRGSQASFWNPYVDSTGSRRTTVADTLFLITAAAGAIIDVVCDLVMPDAGPSQARTGVTIASGVGQAFAYLPLDGYGGVLTAQGVGSFS